MAAERLPVLLDVDGVADHLNISVRHVRRLVFERRIPHLKIGNLLRFDSAEIAAWVRGLAVCGATLDTGRVKVASRPTSARPATLGSAGGGYSIRTNRLPPPANRYAKR